MSPKLATAPVAGINRKNLYGIKEAGVRVSPVQLLLRLNGKSLDVVLLLKHVSTLPKKKSRRPYRWQKIGYAV